MNYHTHKTYTVDEAKARLEQYCAYRERCHKEVTQKLQQMRMIPEAIDQVLLHLLQHDFLNETRFAKAFARGKFKTKKWGKYRITRELKARDISAYNIKKALQEISEEAYRNTFEELVEKRLAQLQQETNLQKKRKKLSDYLIYRGWELDWVYQRAASIKK
ncbi:regulatory protein RecX [Luteirhabdus pelagi]|uniref:regulatory protein RecX n=1 Tax=Luteirhabdus pelagi TaxID=2792783 RepID=UPI00193A8850|nr:regulatory protein RecX [Luteirhabdus pelagi]